MPRDWKPNVPEHKKDFNQKAQALPKQAPPSQIELKKLEAQRKKPEPHLAPKPPGNGKPPSNDNNDLEREKRIAYIKSQLDQNRNRARNDFGNKR